MPIYTDIPFYMWSNSQIVVYWINSSKWLPQFVSHRITKIQQSAPTTSWKYCPTKDNPADLLTRGLTSEQFHATINLSMHGPAWLHDQQQWPKWNPHPLSHLHVIAAVSNDFHPQERSPFNQACAWHQTTQIHTTLTDAYLH